jgi:magnesium transporter
MKNRRSTPRFYKRSRKAGLPPGTLVRPADQKGEEVRITWFAYGPDAYEEEETRSTEGLLAGKKRPHVRWINVDGLHVETLEKVGAHYGIHPLVLEDILNTDQRPKMEDYENFVFVVMKMLRYDEALRTIDGEQISMVLGPDFVISFQERAGDVFEPVRQRIRTRESRLRKSGADYLVYRLLDTVVDNYFTILEKIGDRIEDLEAKVMEDPSQQSLRELHKLKREVIFLRKSIWPLREVISGLCRNETRLIEQTTLVFLRDVHDHALQVIDTLENFREMLTGLLDVHISSTGQRMNEVMKVLTIIATIFIPLTFIAGIYGMNFDRGASPWSMPELGWAWGYPSALLLMAVVAALMVIYFRKKGWL